MACPMYTPRQWIFIGFLALSVTCPLGVRAGEIHVPGDYPTIQQAIDAALPGDGILVDPGTYGGPLNTNLDFGGKDLELRSTNGPDVTIIDCQPSNRRGLFFHNGETASAIVDGFTITRSLFPRGGGIRFMNNSSPTIRNCVFSFHGLGALHCDNSSPSFENCTIADNAEFNPTGGAGLDCSNNSSVTIVNCTFARNNACCGVDGGGILCSASSLMINGSTFLENEGEGGGGIACLTSSLVIRDSNFERNSSDNSGGAGIWCNFFSSATITGCKFYDNFGYEGAALMCTGSTAEVTNCTFVGNDDADLPRASSQVAASGHLTLQNTIVAYSAGKAVTCLGSGDATLGCCDLFGNQEGDWIDCIAGQLDLRGNFAADPLFCNLDSGDLVLNENSPCLPGNHPQGEDCGLIGAFDQGCGATPVQTTTWGAIKSSFAR